jgi:adenosine deaminase
MTIASVFQSLQRNTSACYPGALDDDCSLVLFAFCLPKVELHAHLNGSISMALLRHLRSLRDSTASASATTLSMDDNMLETIKDPKERMSYCFRVFDCVYQVMDNLAYTRLAVQDVLLHYAAEGTVFLELRTSLREGLKSDASLNAPVVTQAAYLSAVRDAAQNILSGTCLYDWRTGSPIDALDGAAMETWLEQLDSIYQSGACLLPRRLYAMCTATGDAKASSRAEVAVAAVLRRSSAVLTPSAVFRQRVEWQLRMMRCVITVSISRSLPLTAAHGTVEVMDALLHQQRSSPAVVPITSVDFSGNCYNQHFSDFVGILQKLREVHHIGITLHAGEKDDAHELEQMIAFAPDRWGHLVFVSDAARSLIDSELKKPIELCPTSNLLTCGHGHMDQHHINAHWDVSAYLALYTTNEEGGENDSDNAQFSSRAPISINTDDRGVFGTSMTEELLLVADHRDVRCLTLHQCMWFLFTLQRRALRDGFFQPETGNDAVPFGRDDVEALFDQVARARSE